MSVLVWINARIIIPTQKNHFHVLVVMRKYNWNFFGNVTFEINIIHFSFAFYKYTKVTDSLTGLSVWES